MKHIVCPLDFSKPSLNALEYAVSIAERHQSKLSLIYVFTEDHYNELLMDGVKKYSEYESGFQAKLETVTSEIESEKFELDSHVLGGSVISSLQNFIKGRDVDLLVTGTKGAGNVLDRIMGSNTVNMLDNIDLPILAVPQKAKFEGLKKIMYATSFEEEDKMALKELVEFSKPLDSEITVLHLSKRDNLIGETLLNNFIEELHSFMDCSQLTFERKIYSENVTLEIDQYMLEEKSNVLALLMSKRNLVDRIFHKSVTKSLSYLMDFPILVFKKS